MSIVICMNPENGTYAKGRTAKEAFNELKENYENEDIPVEECEFFEGDMFEVEVKIERKEVPVKVKAPALPKK